MAPHGGSRVDSGLIAPKQMPDVDNLQQPQHDPVDADEHMAQRERGGAVAEQVVVASGAVGRDVVQVVEGSDELEDPRDEGQDPVGSDVPASTLDITSERVGYTAATSSQQRRSKRRR